MTRPLNYSKKQLTTYEPRQPLRSADISFLIFPGDRLVTEGGDLWCRYRYKEVKQNFNIDILVDIYTFLATIPQMQLSNTFDKDASPQSLVRLLVSPVAWS